MNDETDFLENETLSAIEWKGVQEIEYKAPVDPVVLADLKVGAVGIENLVSKGLVERCAPTPAYAARGYETAFKLSPLGMKVLERGRYSRKPV